MTTQFCEILLGVRRLYISHITNINFCFVFWKYVGFLVLEILKISCEQNRPHLHKGDRKEIDKYKEESHKKDRWNIKETD